MELNRFNKKMIVLCEKTNALWAPVLANGTYKNLDEGFDEIFGTGARRRAESWRKKPVQRALVNLETWSQKITKILGADERRDLFYDSVRASDFAETLGIGPFGQRYLFDTFYSDLNKSSYTSLLFDPRKAEQIIRSFGGRYNITLKPDDSEQKYLGMLEVRYFIPVGLDPINSKKFKIRCKLDFPASLEAENLMIDEEFFEYDGFVSQSHGAMVFHFESRMDAWDARTLLIVCHGAEGTGEFKGRYLKSPFGSDMNKLSGRVSMDLVKRHDHIVLPHSSLQAVG